jgi:uncharacterized phosphosugar-binding protein
MYEQYFDTLERILASVRQENVESLPAAARIVADTVERDGLIHVFGSGHSELLAMEVAGRAGGLACIQVILDPGHGKAEMVEGYAATLLRDTPFEARDALIVISNSGRPASPIEVAIVGHDAGIQVIAVTALDFCQSVSSLHSSGQRLCDVADVVLDTCGAAGDAAIELPGIATAIGPTSTAVGAALLNAMMTEAVAELVGRNVDPPIFVSQNTDGSRDHNERLRARYRGRVLPMT